MTKTLLSGVAAIAFAFAAPTAFAQDSTIDPNVDAKMETEQRIEEAEKAADDLEVTTDELNDTSQELWDTEKTEMDVSDDNVDETLDTDVTDEGYVAPTVDCPDGMTVQPDGTCMVVDDVAPEN